MLNYKYIAIEGNIGIGKTSLAKLIAKKCKTKLLLEEFADNVFLPKFYKNPKRYALALEISFLTDRYRQITEHFRKIEGTENITTTDYFFPKTQIFANNNLNTSEFDVFTKLFDILNKDIIKPDLLIFLYSNIDKIINQIKLRGRPYELKIKKEYLKNVQELYINYLKNLNDYKILFIDVSTIDFISNKNDFINILDLLKKVHSIGIHEIKLK